MAKKNSEIQTAVEEKEGELISLSKANKIRNLVKEHLKIYEMKIAESANKAFIIDETDTAETLKMKREEIIEKTQNLFNIFGTLNSINSRLRVTIATANDRSGLNEIITGIEQIKLGIRPIQILNQIRTFSESDALKIIRQNSAIAEQKSLAPLDVSVQNIPYRSGNFFAFPSDAKEKNDDSIRNLEKEIRALEEKRNELNYTTTIHLSKEIVDVLKTLNII
jgi:hypothetical protein